MAWFERNTGGKKGVETEPQKLPETPKPVTSPAQVAVAPEAKPATPKEIVAPPQPLEAGSVAYLYKGSRVSGQLSFQGPARIDGSVEGEIQCQGILTIGDSADIRAKISAHVVVIRGKVEGNVSAKEKVELGAQGRLIGNIDTPRLVIAEGVVFDGNCAMGVAKPKGGLAVSQGLGADKPAAQAAKLHADSKT